MSQRRTKFSAKKVVILLNKSATSADRSIKNAEYITTRFGKERVTTIDITGFNRDKIQEVIEDMRNSLAKDTLLAIGGGDGTVSSVVRAIVASKKLTQAQKQAVLLPLWGGNANDLAVMLNGMFNAASLEKVFDEGSVVKVYPLKIVITPPRQDPVLHIATCYASFGATAHASLAMEGFAHMRGAGGPKSTLQRFFHELKDSLKTFISISSFGVLGDNNEVERMYERVFVNGSRFARIPNTVVKLTDRKYLEASAKKKHVYILISAFKAFFRKNYGKVTDETQHFIIQDATMAQIDGEIIGLEPDTEVEVGIHDTPFYALSRKL